MNNLSLLEDSKRQHKSIIPINLQLLGGGEIGMQYLKRLTTVLQVFLPKPTGGTISCQVWVYQLQDEPVLTEVFVEFWVGIILLQGISKFQFRR